MTKIVSHSEEITHFRQMESAHSVMAHATEREDLWERPAPDEADDGSEEFDDELVTLIEACAHRDE